MSLAIEAFSENVRRFCQWSESEQHDVETARQLLLVLMQSIPYLAFIDDTTGDLPDYPRRGYEGWKMDHKNFSDFPIQYYRQVFAPCDLNDAPPVIGDAHDDLADIYGDLWHGLQALDCGDGKYAVNYWRESYFQHWGHYASAAIYEIDEYYRITHAERPWQSADSSGGRNNV